MFSRILICLSILFSLNTFAQNTIKAQHVEVSLIASHQQLSAGEKSWWGIQFKLDPHWHVYWKNPGDSGAAPKFNFETENGKAGDVHWPNPIRIKLGDLVNFGYENEVIYPFEVTSYKEGSLKLKANLEWLVCQEECVPGFADLELAIPVLQKSILDQKNSEQISKYLNQTPSQEFKGAVSGKFLKADTYELQVEFPSEDNWDIFPLDGEKLAPQEPQKKIEKSKITWTFKAHPIGELKHPNFVVKQVKEPFNSYEVSVAPISTESQDSILGLIFFAFLGGIILNLMPCVFPVLSIKIFSMVKEAGGGRKALLKEGVFYTLGVLVTFVGLGILFLILRKSGESVGWGFQLQSPVIIYLLILLFFAMALNFLGVYELGTGIMNRAGSKQTGSFGTGVLSVFVAAPCTGPFMGAALGAAVTLPSAAALAIFFFLGLGLALPILFLSASPALTKLLPKPGLWMEKLKQFFAFPLFATALWLFWVLIEQKGSSAVLPAGGGIILMSFALWISFESWKKWMRLVLILIALVYPVMNFKNAAMAFESKPSGPWKPYNKSEIEKARIDQPVFVDFTAAWCITCQWNKKAVLETEAALNIFKAKSTLLIRADWTNYDKNITDALSTFGRSSVPLYVFYPAGGGEPKILPQMLTLSMIEELYK